MKNKNTQNETRLPGTDGQKQMRKAKAEVKLFTLFREVVGRKIH